MNTNPLGDGQTCLSPFAFDPKIEAFKLARKRAGKTPSQDRVTDNIDRWNGEGLQKWKAELPKRQAMKAWMEAFDEGG